MHLDIGAWHRARERAELCHLRQQCATLAGELQQAREQCAMLQAANVVLTAQVEQARNDYDFMFATVLDVCKKGTIAR